jgi:drug/metabolite transporter (DMT)-like permease
MSANQESSYVLSYLTIRKVIGILAILIPILMAFGGMMDGSGKGIRESISNYYYSNMQDVFVGILCAVALFLISYKGYDLIDNISSSVAGIAALGVAFFPMSRHINDPVNFPQQQHVGVFFLNESHTYPVHITSAVLFFLVIAFISFFLFTKTGGKKMTEGKKIRNLVYRICGIGILFFLTLMIAYNIFPKNTGIDKLNPVFWLESLALAFFGFSWLVKGKTLWKEKNKV